MIFIARINRINSRRISGILEFWFLDCPFLLLSSLSDFSNSGHELTSLHQFTSVGLGMILLSAHFIELSVQHDDDK